MTFPAHHESGAPGGAANLKSVLLVEDDSNDAYLATRELKKLKLRNPVLHVPTIEDMIDYMEGKGAYEHRDKYPSPRLVLLDMHIKAADGLDAAAWLRSKSKFRKIAIVAISGSGTDRLQSAVAMGAHALMVKPFNGPEFLKVIERLRVDLEFAR